MVKTSMKISKTTFDILKNFSCINSNIFVQQGNVLGTISPIKTILAAAEVEETFDVPFGIFDLSKFLGTVSLFNDPDFTFHEKYVTISDDNRSIKYHYCDPQLLTIPTQKLEMPEVNVSFELTQGDLNEMRKASAVLGVSDITFRKNDNEELEVLVHDKSNTTSDSYTINLGETDCLANFSMNILSDYLKIVSGDYIVDLSSKRVARFTHKNLGLVYWIALETDSSFNE